jgi:hypothetical protein
MYYLLIFAGWLVYLIVAMIIRKTARVHIGLCERHLTNRRITIFVSWAIFALGVVAIVMAIANESGVAALLGILLIIGAAIYGAFGARTVYASKIDERFAWIKGVNSEYLAQFPQWPHYR